MTVEDRAQQAWEAYKVSMRNHPRRQLRKRDFIAGFTQGVVTEAERTQKYVVPANLTLFGLLRDLQAHPELAQELQAEIPETINKLIRYLRGEEPK